MMSEIIFQILVYFSNLLRYFFSLTHIQIEYLLLFLCIPNPMHQFILKHLISDHRSIKIPLDFFRHFESLLCQLSEFLLEEVHPIIYQRIVLA